MKRISAAICCLAIAFASLSCMNIPRSVIERREWFADSRPGLSAAAYALPWDGTWLPAIWVEPDEIERLMLVNIADDPFYEAFEIQLFGTPDGLRGVFIAERKDGSRDYYYQPGVPMDEARKASIRALLNDPTLVERDFSLAIEADERGLSAMADIIDRDGRRLFFSVRENSPGRASSSILAPVSAGAERPSSLPMVYLDAFAMVAKKGTEFAIEIDGRSRKPAGFPLVVNGRRVFYARYATKVAVADLVPAYDGLLAASPIEAGSSMAVWNGGSYDLDWSSGRPAIRAADFISGSSRIELAFSPALPDIRGLRPGVVLEGRFVVGVNDVDAVIAGDYRLSQGESGAKLELLPAVAWQPPMTSKRPWVAGFIYEARYEPSEGGAYLRSAWSRTGP